QVPGTARLDYRLCGGRMAQDWARVARVGPVDEFGHNRFWRLLRLIWQVASGRGTACGRGVGRRRLREKSGSKSVGPGCPRVRARCLTGWRRAWIEPERTGEGRR